MSGYTPPSDTRNPLFLNAEEIAAFDEQGYLILRERIPQDLRQRLADASARWIANGRQLAEDSSADGDFGFADRPGGRRLFRVNYLHAKGEAASLELLGSPELLAIAESLAGPNFVPTYESLVFKDEGDGAPIPWHQDAVHPRNHRIFNIDVYLDASHDGAGALRVVPGSQHSTVDVCALTDTHGWDVPGAVVVEMEPGDVLIHDVMLVHGSEPVVGNRMRRTIYYEFRPAEQILGEGPWDRQFVDARLRLLPVALDHYGRMHPDDPGFRWNIDESLRPMPSNRVDTELRVAHRVHSQGSFCSAGDVPGRLDGLV
ncbi:phytanoyl-CoA dioxygenase family protein [Streptomyces sp. NPDC055749]